AHDVDFAAEFAATKGVPKLVHGLGKDQAQEQQEQIVRRQHGFGLFPERVPVVEGYFARPTDHGEPKQGAYGTDQPSDQWQAPLEKVVRIEQRETGEHDVEQLRLDLALAALAVALEEFAAV